MLEDIFDDRQGKKVAVLEFLDQADALHIAIIIIGNVSSPLAGLGKETFADVIMNRLFGYARSLNQLADFQEKTPGEGRKAQNLEGQRNSSFFRTAAKTLLAKQEKIVKKNLVGPRFFLTFMHSIE
jgi:hypothetical protein